VQDPQHRASTLAAYERLAEVWDETDDNLFNEGLERTAVRQLVPRPLDGSRVLDAGCAGGAHATWLADEGGAVIGFDLSPAMVRRARARCGGAARFVVADLSEPPFATSSFDGILCSLALHYLEDFSPTLEQFARIVRPGGWLLLTLDHPAGAGPGGQHSGDYFATRLLTETWRKGDVSVIQSFWRRPLAAVTDALVDAGFAIERIGEPQLDDVLRQRFPDEAAMIEGRPTFIAYLAKKSSPR
jgi:SAM-dependent methyltransferase